MSSLYSLANRFWGGPEAVHLTTAAIALYSYLCYRANLQYWEMPIACPSDVITSSIGISRQALCNARKLLKELGFLDFSEGVNQNCLPLYFLLEKPLFTATDLTPQLTPDLTADLTAEHTPQLTPERTPLNLNNKNKDKETEIDKASAVLPSFSALESLFLEDKAWQESVIGVITSDKGMVLSQEQLESYLHLFFQYLAASGLKEREEKDTRNYFINWLRKKLGETNVISNGNNSGNHGHDRRRAAQVPASQKTDFRSSF